MRSNRSMQFSYRTEVCDLCRCAIDVPSGFFFEVDDGSDAIVHPDCMAYFIRTGERPTRGVSHTCGDARCVNPAHLEAVILED